MDRLLSCRRWWIVKPILACLLSLSFVIAAGCRRGTVQSTNAEPETGPRAGEADRAARPNSFDDRQELQGKWYLFAAATEGITLGRDRLNRINNVHWVIEGDRYTVMVSGEKFLGGALRLASAHSPKWIDVTDDQQPGAVQLGIYEVADGVFKVQLAKAGYPRSVLFSEKTDRESNYQWMLFRRTPLER